MTLQFHPDAAENFREKGETLGDSIELRDPDKAPSPPSGFPIDPYVKRTLTEDEVEEIRFWSRSNMAGDEHSRFYPVDGQILALEEERYREFRNLADQMRDTNPLRGKVARKTVMDAVGEWLVRCSLDKVSGDLPRYVLEHCEEQIHTYNVFVPIFQLWLEEAVEVGQVTLRPITRADFDNWARLLEAQVENEEVIQTWMERWRNRMQGQVSAVIQLEADHETAFQVARDEAKRAVAMLRIFNLAMLHPRVRCYCALTGRENTEQRHAVFVRNGSTIGSHSGFTNPAGFHWKVSRSDVAKFGRAGLDQLSQLLQEESPSKFQRQLLQALLIYSRAAVEGDQTEKLLHIFVALESLLLRNPSEPISTNVSERMAFLIRTGVQERKAVTRSVREAYASRSGYLHHAKRVEEPENLVEFMRYAWDFFLLVSRHHDRFQDKQEFIDEIENVKFR